MNFLKKFFKHPWIIIVVCTLITGFLGFFIKDLTLNNSTRDFFPKKNASYERLTQTEETFGSMLSIGVSLETKTGSIITPEYIEVIRRISDRALELKDVEDVDSLTDIDFVCDENGSICATPLIPDTYTGSAQDIIQLLNRLNDWSDMYNGALIKNDGTGVQMLFSIVPKNDIEIAYDNVKEELDLANKELETAKASQDDAAIAEAKAKADEALKAFKDAKHAKRIAKPDSERQKQVYYDIRSIIEEECEGHALEYRLYGDPVLSDNSKEFMIADLVRLIPLVVTVVVITLYMSFHTYSGTLLPLITVLMAAMQSCGLMGLFHITFTLVSSVIPVALIAVGSAYGIHVMTHYYVALKEADRPLTKEIYQEAIFKGLNEVKLAVFLAGITTIVGFISLVTSPLEPLHSFAIFTAIGIGISLILSVTFIPAILLLRPYDSLGKKHQIDKLTDKVRQKIEREYQRRGGRTVSEASGDTLYLVYRFFCGTQVRLIITSIAIIILSITGLKMLKIDTALISYFSKTSQFRKDIDHADQEFAGTNILYFNITGQEKGDITNPELLKAVDDMEKYLLDKYDDIGKIISLNSFIKKINQVWHVPAINDEQNGISANEVESWNDGFDNSFDSFDSFDDEFESWDSSSDFAEASADDFADWNDFDTSFDDDSFGESSVAFDSLDSTSGEIGQADWVDPNLAYAKVLTQQITAKEVLDMLRAAYVAAGGETASVTKIVRQLMTEMNYNGMAYYEIPYDPEKYPVATREELNMVVNNYLTLLSGSLERFIDDDMSPKQMRMQCQLRNHSSEFSGQVIEDAKRFAAVHFPAGYTLEATGTSEMEDTMTSMVVSSQFSSLILSLISVFLIITISFRSGWAGLLGAIPLAFTILLNYMTMGFAKINLDFITSIIASVAVGVGIDYTIHFLTTYREERSRTSDLTEVTKMTFKKSGHGIITNALAVAFGFIVLVFSKFVVLRYIGILVAIVMLTSSFLAMTIIPGILNLTDPKFMQPKKKESK